MTYRRKTDGDPRGSAADRRARKLWLLSTYGDGELTTCYLCAVPLLYADLTVDRIVPGCKRTPEFPDGGTYTRSNIRPACGFCNSSTGSALSGIRSRTELHSTV